MDDKSAIRNPQSAINIAAIESELTSLWQQASQEEHGGVIRAASLNLIVFESIDADSAQLDETLAEVTAAHPCRAILILSDRRAESPLTAAVTSRCHLPTATSKQVCCEQVTVTAREANLAEVPSVVPPLLLSDLPVYLWWRTVPKISDRAVFSRLAEMSDRVIIDSADFDDPRKDIARVGALLRDTPRWTALSDLNWARLTTWRSLLAGFYDVKEYRALLDELDRVVIQCSPNSADSTDLSARALLLGGWLASRLGWRLADDSARQDGGSTSFEYSKKGRKTVLEFARTSRQIEPGRIAMVTLACAGSDETPFIVRRSSDAQRIETAVSASQMRVARRVLSYEGLKESELIARELEILGHDRVYEQAVLAADEMIKHLSPSDR